MKTVDFSSTSLAINLKVLGLLFSCGNGIARVSDIDLYTMQSQSKLQTIKQFDHVIFFIPSLADKMRTTKIYFCGRQGKM